MGKEGGEGSVRTSPEGVGGQWVLVVIPGGEGHKDHTVQFIIFRV